MEEFNERNRKAREEAGLTTPTLADRLSGTGTQQ
jgi:ribosome-binding protein aMBF1 (putative translation factor)